jgi:hypothetical protein
MSSRAESSRPSSSVSPRELLARDKALFVGEVAVLVPLKDEIDERIESAHHACGGGTSEKQESRIVRERFPDVLKGRVLATVQFRESQRGK